MTINNNENSPQGIDLSPERKQQYALYDRLKIEFAELFEEKQHLLAYEESYLTALYLELIGQKQYELFTLQTEVGRLRMKQQLIQASLNRDEKPDLNIIEAKIDKKFAAYYEQIKQQMEDLESAKEHLLSPGLSQEDATEFKTLYRLLVKELHPDLHPDLSSQKMDLFHQVQAAYQLCDLHKIREYALLINTSQEGTGVKLDYSITEMVESLQHQITKLKEQIEGLNKRFPFTYRTLLQDKEWVESQHIQYEKEIALYEKEKQRLLDIIDLQTS